MTKKNKFHIPDKKGMDEIIKMGVEMDIPDVKDVITDEDLLAAGYSLPPADLLEKTKKRIAEEQKTSKKVLSFRKVGKRVVIAVAVFMLLFALSLSVKSVRVYVFGIVNRITDNAIKFHGTSDSPYAYDIDEEGAYKDAEEELGMKLLNPSYLPDGFVADRVKIYPNSHAMFFYKKGTENIRLYQYILDSGSNIETSVRTDSAFSHSIKAHEKEILINKHKQTDSDGIWLSAVWDDGKLLYRVEATCNNEDFEKFILNLE